MKAYLSPERSDDYGILRTLKQPAVVRKLLTPKREEMFSDWSHEICEERVDSRNGAFPYILNSFHHFNQMVIPHLRSYMTVIDVGCGAGDKLLAFKDLESTLTVSGVEIDPVMVRLARYMAPFAYISEGDAFALDYSLFDLIYMYWPIKNFRRQSDLQWLCMQTMKPGAVLLVAGQQQSSDYPTFPDLYKGWVKPL